MKNEDDVKPEKTTIHPSNNNNAAEVHEEKSAESHPLLPLLNLSYCLAHTVNQAIYYFGCTSESNEDSSPSMEKFLIIPSLKLTYEITAGSFLRQLILSSAIQENLYIYDQNRTHTPDPLKFAAPKLYLTTQFCTGNTSFYHYARSNIKLPQTSC